MNMSIVSKYLQFLRKGHNYTQDDLAQKLDITRRQYQNGKQELPIVKDTTPHITTPRLFIPVSL